MPNRVIKHEYFETIYPTPQIPKEPDKSKSISELSIPEMYKMLERLRTERDVQEIVRTMKRNSGERETYEEPFKIDTKTPINQLYHFGILGQKWGIRRYQNKDGSRTPLGRKKDEQFEKSKDYKESRNAKTKGVKGLSNEELKKLNERLQLEETYKKLTKEDLKRGESWVKANMKKIGTAAFVTVGTGVAVGAAKMLIQKVNPKLAEVAFSLKEKKD